MKNSPLATRGVTKPAHSPMSCGMKSSAAVTVFPAAGWFFPAASTFLYRSVPGHPVGCGAANPCACPPREASASTESNIRPSRGHIQPSRTHIFYRPVPGRPLRPSEHTLPPIGEYEKFPPSHAWGYQTSPFPHVVRNEIFSRGHRFSSRGHIFFAPCQGAVRGGGLPIRALARPCGGKRVDRIQHSAKPHAQFLTPRARAPAQAIRTHPPPYRGI